MTGEDYKSSLVLRRYMGHAGMSVEGGLDSAHENVRNDACGDQHARREAFDAAKTIYCLFVRDGGSASRRVVGSKVPEQAG